MHARRKKQSGLRQWILAVAVVILAIAVVPLQKYFASLKAKREEVPVLVPTPGAAVPRPTPRPPTPTPTPAPTQPPRLPQAAQDSNAATQAERSRYDGLLKAAESRAKLELSEDEHRRLLDDVIDVEHVREDIEQSLVAVESFDGTMLSLKIPAYPEQGKTLKAALDAQIAQDFSQERAAEISAGLDGSSKELFGLFGMLVQAFTVTSFAGDDDKFGLTFTNPYEGEGGRITESWAVDRGTLLSQWKALAPQINSHFPPKVQPTAQPGSP